MTSDDMTRHDYWTEVRRICEDILSDVKSGEIESEDDVSDRIWETIDGHQWIIYTAHNFDVLRFSENDGYAAEEFGIDSVVEDGSIKWSALAFGALYADVMETLDMDDIREAFEAREASTV